MDSRDRLQGLLRRTMSSLKTPFEQLVFLASIRDNYTGRYLHEGWAQVASGEEVHRVAHRMHMAAFNSVLEMELGDLTRQLQQHFQSLGDKERDVARLWLETEPFREMLPTRCTVLEREMFVSQMRLALEVLVRSLTSPAQL